MRLVFAGTPTAAVPSLERLADSDHEVALVVTRTDAPLGRKRVLTPSPVAQAAERLGLDVLRTDRLDAAATERIERLRPDLGVIVAYGGLVREPLLSDPVHGWINLHFSLLPRWRGAAPVQRALIAGDREIGTAVFQLVPELDAGAVYAQEGMPTPPFATAGEMLDRLALSGADMLARVVEAIADGTAVARPQEGEETYATKLTAEDGRIRWDQDAGAVLDRIRATTPEPGAFTTIDGARLKILSARRGEGVLAPGRVDGSGGEVRVGTAGGPVVLERVQPAGKQAMAATDWWRGLRGHTPELGS